MTDRESVLKLRAKYPVGARVRLIAMSDDPYPVPSGTLGTVTGVDDAGNVHVRWDNGSGLALVPGIDVFEVRSESGTQ